MLWRVYFVLYYIQWKGIEKFYTKERYGRFEFLKIPPVVNRRNSVRWGQNRNRPVWRLLAHEGKKEVGVNSISMVSMDVSEKLNLKTGWRTKGGRASRMTSRDFSWFIQGTTLFTWPKDSTRRIMFMFFLRPGEKHSSFLGFRQTIYSIGSESWLEKSRKQAKSWLLCWQSGELCNTCSVSQRLEGPGVVVPPARRCEPAGRKGHSGSLGTPSSKACSVKRVEHIEGFPGQDTNCRQEPFCEGPWCWWADWGGGRDYPIITLLPVGKQPAAARDVQSEAAWAGGRENI